MALRTLGVFWFAVLMGCQSTPTQTTTVLASLPGMGTVWQVTGQGCTQDLSLTDLTEKLRQDLALVENAISDWDSSSELRQWEQRGLTSWHRPSPALEEVFRVSSFAYRDTQGLFDPTVGQWLWTKNDNPLVTWGQLRQGELGFRFAKDPQRLTFGEIAKGIALGRWMALIQDAECLRFDLRAGGSSQIIWDVVDQSAQIISRSSPGKGVFHPQKGRVMSGEPIQLSCRYSALRPLDAETWARRSGLVDAYSTSGLLDSQQARCPPNDN